MFFRGKRVFEISNIEVGDDASESKVGEAVESMVIGGVGC